MGKLITIALPNDLPENWTDNQYVTPGGTEAGLTEQHGFNYLMTQVNNAQKAINELDTKAFGGLQNQDGMDLDTFRDIGARAGMHIVNRPEGTSIYGIAWNVSGAGGFYQIQYYFDSMNKVEYRRQYVDGMWSLWTPEAAPTTVYPATVE